MKLINKEVLSEYGFEENKIKSTATNTVMTREKMDIVIKSDDTIWYSNMGFDYPLKDLAALRKLYKEMRNMDLKPIK